MIKLFGLLLAGFIGLPIIVQAPNQPLCENCLSMVGNNALMGGYSQSVQTYDSEANRAIKNEKKARAMAVKYGIDEGKFTALLTGNDLTVMYNLAECESSLNPLAWNKNDPNGGSFGLFQYQIPTFYHYAKVYGIKNPDIWNVEQQIELTAYLIQDNKINLWTCGRNNNKSFYNKNEMQKVEKN